MLGAEKVMLAIRGEGLVCGIYRLVSELSELVQVYELPTVRPGTWLIMSITGQSVRLFSLRPSRSK